MEDVQKMLLRSPKDILFEMLETIQLKISEYNMSEENVRFKIRAVDREWIVSDLTLLNKLADLKKKAADLTGYDLSHLVIRQSLSRPDFDFSKCDDQKTLRDLGFAHQECLHVSDMGLVPGKNHRDGSNMGLPVIDSAGDSKKPIQNSSQPKLHHPIKGGGGHGTNHFREEDEAPPEVNEISTSHNNGTRKGVLLRKSIAADNACLFSSLHFLLDCKENEQDSVRTMRNMVSDYIEAEPDEFPEAVLERPRDDYIEWIKRETSWGGGIELAILSRVFEVEIDVIYTQSGSVSKFGEDMLHNSRVLLLYDGIHYDALYKSYSTPHGEQVRKIFPLSDNQVLEEAKELACELRGSSRYIDTRKLNVMCSNCNILLTGTGGPEAHARETGHIHFKECSVPQSANISLNRDNGNKS
ncbi:unnamed protein product [Darwinula stevensoni]|uniref:Ubiquitin thioesterase OTU n=1 Tax=Darwinula stevensoni TaxID=69355 RepID=A0A7R9FR54_9CRUS|nr:unnamed protein product [Darwinula stevensoni]CAG0900786.1 unnamed protein product [Darwinula stevensoni]